MNMIVASAMERTAIFFSIFFKPAVIHHLALYPTCCLAFTSNIISQFAYSLTRNHTALFTCSYTYCVTYLARFSSEFSSSETVINKLFSNIDYLHKFNGCVIEHLRNQLKDLRREAIINTRDCFG